MNWQSTARGVRRIARKDGGQDLVEYGMLAALIAIGAMLALRSFSSALRGLWDGVASFI